MQLSVLLAKIPVRETRGSTGVDIQSLCYDSRQAGPGALFVALPGAKVDGRVFARQAVERGAAAVIIENEVAQDLEGATCVAVENARLALAGIAAAYYRNPGY